MCWLFIFKDTEPSPLQDSSSVRQQGGLPGPPPRSPSPRIHRRPGGLPLTSRSLSLARFRLFEILLFSLKIRNEAEGGLNFGGGALGEVLHTDSAVLVGSSYLGALPHNDYLSARGACAPRMFSLALAV